MRALEPIIALTILFCVYAAGELIAQKTKAVFSTVLGIAILLLAGFWSGILPRSVIEDAQVTGFGNVIAGILIVSLGTTIDFPELRRQWKVVVTSLVCVVGATLAIILIARATSCYGAGILASLFGVFWVNFAFTYPYMTLNFTMSGYPITFVGMMLISCLASSICIMITKQNVQLQEKDRMLLNAEKETIRANLMRAMSHDLRTPLTSIIGSSSTYLSQEEYMSPGEKRKLVRRRCPMASQHGGKPAFSHQDPGRKRHSLSSQGR